MSSVRFMWARTIQAKEIAFGNPEVMWGWGEKQFVSGLQLHIMSFTFFTLCFHADGTSLTNQVIF